MKTNFLFVIIFISINTFAQDSTLVYPLKSDLILMHIDEGFVDHADAGEKRNEGAIVFRNALNVDQATLTSNYQITSGNDPTFSSPVVPSEIYRKTKATDFANYCDTYVYIPFYDTIGCVNLKDDHVDEHWLYLELPLEMTEGSDYMITINNELYDGLRTFQFSYEPASSVSEMIHTNNVAYSTEAEEKYGYVYEWMGDGGGLNLEDEVGSMFHIINNETGTKVFTGSLEFRRDENQQETFQSATTATKNQNFLGAPVYQCDFSSFNTPGDYHLYVEGIGRSFDFQISCDAMRKPFEYAMKGIFQNRSGITLSHPYVKNPRPAPHNVTLTPGFAGRLKYSTTTLCEVNDADASSADKELWESGYVGDLTSSYGWYQDAGDWDAYPSHHKIPSMLLLAYDLYPNHFTDGQLVIPESGNGVPDILDEARWLLRFYKRLKDETEEKGWTTGGIPGARIFGDLWGEDLGEENIIRGSWQDVDRDWYVSGEERNMTFLYAAVAAQFHFLLERDGLIDPEGINWLAEAESAYAWANVGFVNGEICQDFLLDESRNYAAAALYRASGESFYHQDFVASWNALVYDGLTVESGFGPYIYAFTDSDRDASVVQEIESLIIGTADYNMFQLGDDRSCRWGGNPFFPMLVGQSSTPFIIEALVAEELVKGSDPDKAAEYRRIAYNTADYFLGNNPLRMTWITGLGERSPSGILDLDSWALGDGTVKDGVVPYGPWRQQGIAQMGAYHNQWPEQWIYPVIDEWPGHERWFSQRYNALGSEYTVHQNGVTAAFVYGALSGDYECSEVVSIQDLELVDENKIVVFPNPTPGVFRITGLMQEYELNVINAVGQQVLRLPEIGNNFDVDLSSLGDGMYFLKLVGKNGKLSMEQVIKL